MAHSRINLLFLSVVSGHSDCFRKTIQAFGYHQFLYPEGYDPLFFALESKNSSILEEFVEYFECTPGAIDRVLYSQEFIVKSLGCSSNRFRLFIATSIFVVPPSKTFELSLPDQLLTNSRDFFEVIPCKTFRNKKNVKKIFDLFRKNEPGAKQKKVEYKRSCCPLDIAFTSKFTTELLTALEVSQEEVLMSNLGYIIRH